MNRILEVHQSFKSYLIFVQFTIFIFLFTFILKCNNDKTNENIHHKKSNDLDKFANNNLSSKSKQKKILTTIKAMKNGATNGR